jgi:hypothetical protein
MVVLGSRAQPRAAAARPSSSCSSSSRAGARRPPSVVTAAIACSMSAQPQNVAAPRAASTRATTSRTAAAATWRAEAGAVTPKPRGPWIFGARPGVRLSSPAARASAASSAPTTTATFEFACPICHSTPFHLPAANPYASDCACPRCGRTFLVASSSSPSSPAASSSAYVDLTLQSGAPPAVFEQKSWVGTELFRTEAVSSIYERGWRQGFARAGFPGPQREFDLAMRYFGPVLSGAAEASEQGGGGGGGGGSAGGRPVLVDASCGTGLFTRLFARSGEFSGVVALDYSETMLRETRRLLNATR